MQVLGRENLDFCPIGAAVFAAKPGVEPGEAWLCLGCLHSLPPLPVKLERNPVLAGEKWLFVTRKHEFTFSVCNPI